MKKRIKLMAFLFVSMTIFSSCEDSSTSNANSCEPNCNSVQCAGNTQQGNRCKNMTTNCCGYCYLHK